MKFLTGLIFLFNFSANAQVNSGPRFTAMASSGVSLRDVWSMQQNQAGLAATKKITIAVAFEKPFAGYELSTQSAILALPVKNNVFGLSFQRYGFASYSEQRTALAYSRNFGDRLYAALNFNYHILKINGYGSAQTYSVEAGLQYRLTDQFFIGAHLANPNQSTYPQEVSSIIPGRFQFGASYLLGDKVLLAVAAEKYFHHELDIRSGLEYQIVELLALRGGFSANPFKQYAGFGLNYQHLKMDVAVAAHPVLGYSPQIALSYEF
jgi:hypothetical protein